MTAKLNVWVCRKKNCNNTRRMGISWRETKLWWQRLLPSFKRNMFQDAGFCQETPFESHATYRSKWKNNSLYGFLRTRTGTHAARRSQTYVFWTTDSILWSILHQRLNLDARRAIYLPDMGQSATTYHFINSFFLLWKISLSVTTLFNLPLIKAVASQGWVIHGKPSWLVHVWRNPLL